MNGQNSARHRCTDYIFPWKNNREIDNRSFPLATTQQVPPKWNWVGLKASDVSLPNLFRKAGYQTIHVGKAHFAPKDREGENPLNLGFDVNVAGTCFGAPGSYYGTRSFGAGSKNLHARPVPHLEKYHGQNIFLTEALTLEAKAEIDKALNASKPFLLHMSHYAVHSPFQSDPRFAKNYQGKSPSLMAYATMIEGMDKSLGDLIDHIETKGVAENTFIIFLGDNGGDAPDKVLDGISSCAPLRGRKGAKWEGGMRVPFIASWGKVNHGNASQKDNPIVPNSMRQEFGVCFDLLPTLCKVAQIKIPKSHKMDGQELGDLFAGKSNSDHRDVFLNHYPHPRRGKSQFFTTWRNGDWKVIYEYLNSGPKRYSLFNLKNDISESNNLAEKHPDKLRKMMTEMVDELTKMKALYPVKEAKELKPVIPGA
jgi:arylsulfatase A-like enzyme